MEDQEFTQSLILTVLVIVIIGIGILSFLIVKMTNSLWELDRNIHIVLNFHKDDDSKDTTPTVESTKVEVINTKPSNLWTLPNNANFDV